MSDSSPSKRRFDGLANSSPPRPSQRRRVTTNSPTTFPKASDHRTSGPSSPPSNQAVDLTSTSVGDLASISTLLTPPHPTLLPDISQLYRFDPPTPSLAIEGPSATAELESESESMVIVSLEELERRLEKETHETRLALQEAMDQDKGTNKAYPRQLARYHAWFSMDQDLRIKEDPMLPRLSSQPITATKVALYLKWEATRPKVM